VIQPGADADLTLVDLTREWTVDDAKLQSRSKISPWHGRPVKGLPLHTLVRGKFVMRERALVPDARGWGRSVHSIQEMPPPAVRNSDRTLQAVTSVSHRQGQAA
jgi:dihydroorotase